MINRDYTVQELINDTSFIRWATGVAHSIEVKRWNEWVEFSEHNRTLAMQAQHLVTGIHFEVPSDLHKEENWRQIEQKILAKKRAPQFHPLQKRGIDSFAVFLKMSAVFLIVAFSGVIALNMSGDGNIGVEPTVSVQTISSDFSEKRTISLSDGSTIILAAGTIISYKEDWLSQPTYQVTLEKGEAYFSIKPEENRNQNIPRFEVVTEDGITAVLGTRFSVSTYGDGTQVVLEKGEVQVRPVETEVGDPSAVTLTPGKMAQWTKQQTGITLTDVNPRVYTSWAFDHLYFDQTPLSLLVERIKRTYGVDVEVEDPSLLDLKLSGAVDFYTLDALILAVSDVLDIRIKKIQNRVLIEKMNS